MNLCSALFNSLVLRFIIFLYTFFPLGALSSPDNMDESRIEALHINGQPNPQQNNSSLIGDQFTLDGNIKIAIDGQVAIKRPELLVTFTQEKILNRIVIALFVSSGVMISALFCVFGYLCIKNYRLSHNRKISPAPLASSAALSQAVQEFIQKIQQIQQADSSQAPEHEMGDVERPHMP